MSVIRKVCDLTYTFLFALNFSRKFDCSRFSKQLSATAWNLLIDKNLFTFIHFNKYLDTGCSKTVAKTLQYMIKYTILNNKSLKKNPFFYNRQKIVTFMHRHQVAKYVIFHSEKIFVKKFPWMLK
jgi:hypothetical protein